MGKHCGIERGDLVERFRGDLTTGQYLGGLSPLEFWLTPKSNKNTCK